MFDFKFYTTTHSMLNDRPPFTKMVEIDEQPIINGYTLQVDVDNQQASIINLKKGGEVSMKKIIVKALEGFEKQFDDLNEMKANIEAEIEIAKADAIAEVEARFAVKVQRIDKVLEDVSVTEEIEVPDTTEDVAITDAPVQTDTPNDNEIVNDIVNETEIL